MPSTEEICARVIDVLQKSQEASGREQTEIEDSSCPMEVLDGFDSLAGIEVTVLLEEVFSIHLDRENVFLGEDEKPRSVRQVAAEIAKIASKGKDK